ncbi:CRAL-TRIO domain-containing protein [Suillus paluster]|uniref:CRAL-TRIO domain-containing protein n=1 Tax=Suillus paluster TaxID=48578 RepID=UPI001B8835BB|nr:CRAL-TRIO domain-containing protein [Suillus paluster]KAG1729620.1 CRAL-TRIO domain-containing protein [Suillus paluster]
MSIHVPVPVPTHPEQASPPALSEKEQTLYDLVLEHFSAAEYRLPGITQKKSALMVDEKFWLSYECLLRYLRATKWDANEAIKRLEDTLKWRRDFGIYDKITPEHVEPEGTTGKEFLFGYDTHGRPALYMCPSKRNTEESPRQIHYVVWILERAIDLMGPGVETLALMINYADKSKNLPIGTTRTVINILQTHYPERLGLALIAHLPWLLHAFYKLITSFIDPLTRLKIVFNPVINENGLFRAAADAEAWSADSASTSRVFEPGQLVQEGWNGSQPFTYSHAVYWEALVKLCEERRSRMVAAWHRIGGKVGTKEWEVKVAVRDETMNT